MKSTKLILTIFLCWQLGLHAVFAQTQSGKLILKVIGIGAGETFKFKDIDNRELVFTAPTTKVLEGLTVGSQYSFTTLSTPRDCKITNGVGTVGNATITVEIDCTYRTFRKFELVSRSTDKKLLGTFYGSSSPSIGGEVATAVKEGQFVAYMTSWNVDAKHGGKNRQIVWYNRGNEKTVVVSRGLDGMGGNKDSYEPVIDARGYSVAFESHATNLVQGDLNNASDVFIWNLMNDQLSCVTCEGNAPSASASISRGGRFVAFSSNASNLTAGVDGTSLTNAFVKDMQTGEIILLSKDPKTGKALGGRHPSISEDGNTIAFYSYADKLVEGDNNKLWDIFVWERGNPQLKRISLTTNGTERNQGNESMSRLVVPTISGNGKYVTFSTTASNMVEGEVTQFQQVYVAEIATGRIIRASENLNKIAGDDDSPIAQGEKVPISFDGAWVAFPTKSKNLGSKMIVKNIFTGETIALGEAYNLAVGRPAISRDGNSVVFPTSSILDKKLPSSGIFASDKQ